MGAAAGFVFIDNVSLMEVQATCDDGIQNGNEEGVDCGGDCEPCEESGPTVAAPTPPNRPAEDVVSIFSDAYADISVNQWGPDWGPSSARINDVMVDGNPTKEVDVAAGQVFAGIDFASSLFDATTFTHFHMDYYIESPIPTGQILNTKLSNHDGGAGETSAIQDTQTPVADQWVQLDILLDDFVAASDPENLARNAIAQIVLTAARADVNVPVKIYVDNIYFHKNTLSSEEFTVAEFKAYPNPTKSDWTITSTSAIKTISVYNILGKQVATLMPNSSEAKISTSNLRSGMYFARIEGLSGTKTIKLIKE